MTGILSLVGLQIGNGLGRRFGKTMEIIAGIMLIGIGARIVAAHLLG
ncbi:MAG: manganese efflux pump [Chloroflexi bacterium]|nr:manganese efflux pump [Chloroflexota bacterium]